MDTYEEESNKLLVERTVEVLRPSKVETDRAVDVVNIASTPSSELLELANWRGDSTLPVHVGETVAAVPPEHSVVTGKPSTTVVVTPYA
jgi:hypothetical protein